MKKIIFILTLMLAVSTISNAQRYSNRHVSISVQTFYDELSPYGDWIRTPDYGYVWRPYFDNPEAFRPYSSNGYWANTEYGWTWVSDYRWGWATFHYGRWTFDDYLGWMWIPGYEWAPAWVTWGSYDDNWGWAPLGPEINVSINFNWHAPDFWWTFVPCRHFYSDNWHSYIYDRPVYVNNITYITNIYDSDNNHRRNNNSWFYGPRVNEVERNANTRVRQMRVVDNDRPDNMRVSNDEVRVYRPSVERKRDNYSPSESRNVENARTGSRIQQRDARSNDPGMNRSRETRTETRAVNQPERERNTAEPRVQPGREKSSNEGSIRNNDGNRSSALKREVSTPESRPSRQINPAIENVKRSEFKDVNVQRSEPARNENRNIDNRKNEPRQTPEVQRNRKQDSPSASPSNNAQPSKREIRKENKQKEKSRNTEAGKPARNESDGNRRK